MAQIVVTSLSPESSSRLPVFVGKSVERGHRVEHAWPAPSRLRRVLLMATTFHPSRRRWRDAFERETEHRLRSWREFSERLQANPAVSRSDAIVQVGLHFDSFPASYRGKRALYLHGTLSMILGNAHFDCSMWCPPRAEIPAWMEAEREVLRRADRIFIGSRFLAPLLERDYGVPAGKISFAGTGPPPFPDGSTEPRGARRSQRILFVGRDFERKGGAVLVRAMPRVVASFPEARLQIVGPGRMPPGLPPSVEFLGRIDDRQRLDRLYREAAVFAMPSLHDSFGFTFLEAMSRGLPCVGTDHFAMPEIIQDGRTGLLVPPGDADRLADALCWMLAHPDEAARMGAAGRQHAAASFSWHLVGDRMLGDLGLPA
jgi:glycosyltransferase involved in cell wall biosynthesis